MNPLQQLRDLEHATPEIYTLGSIVYKLVALEAPTSTTVITDIGRWLPWNVVQTVFQEDLVATLHSIQISKMQKETLLLLYLHCAQPFFSYETINKQSAIGAVLCTWVHNVAAAYDIVDPTFYTLMPIDTLLQHGIAHRDLAHLVLLLFIYPHVHTYVGQTTVFPSNNNSEDYHQDDHTCTNMTSKLQSREHPSKLSVDEVEPSKDFVVVYKLFLPSSSAPQLQEKGLDVVNYMSERRKELSTLETMRQHSSSNLLNLPSVSMEKRARKPGKSHTKKVSCREDENCLPKVKKKSNS